MPYCYICNRTVEISNVNKFPDYEESVFSCGHSSKLYKRTVSDSVSLTEKIEVTPKKGENIPVTVSGYAGTKIHSNLEKINILREENKPVGININITNINAPLTGVKLSQNISETITIDNILTNLEQNSLPIDIKNDVRNLINLGRR